MAKQYNMFCSDVYYNIILCLSSHKLTVSYGIAIMEALKTVISSSIGIHPLDKTREKCDYTQFIPTLELLDICKKEHVECLAQLLALLRNGGLTVRESRQVIDATIEYLQNDMLV